MSLSEELQLVTSMGQMTQIRAIYSGSDVRLPENIQYTNIKTSDGIIIILDDLEIDLFGRLHDFASFLDSSQLADHMEFEIDLEDYEEPYSYTLLLNKNRELLFLYSSSPDKQHIQERVMIEWIKRLDTLKTQ